MPGAVITESDSFPTTLTTPQANETASAPALLSEFLQGCANRTRWLFNRLNIFVIGGELDPTGNLSIFTPTTKRVRINGLSIGSNDDTGDVSVLGSGGLAINAGTLSGGTHDLNIATPTTKKIVANSLTMDAAADGGTVQAIGVGGFQVPNGNFLAGSAAHVLGTLTVDTDIACAGFVTGKSRVAQGAVAGATYTFAAASTDYVWNAATPTVGTVWKVSDSTPNKPIRFSNQGSGGGGIAIQNPSGTLLAVLNSVDGSLCGVTICFTGGQHQIIDTAWKS